MALPALRPSAQVDPSYLALRGLACVLLVQIFIAYWAGHARSGKPLDIKLPFKLAGAEPFDVVEKP